MNIVIIEDELLTAEDLTEIIGRAGKDIRIMAALDSVKAAIEFFKKEQPVDLVFSDIQLGDGLSFEIFRAARVEAPIIFCTAYDEYALDAIRNNGIEYILKPFTAESIFKAIEKYNQLKKHFIPSEIDYEKIIRAITGDDTARKQVGSILVYHRDKVLPIRLDEVALFYIENELTHLHCFNGKFYVVNQTMEELEEFSKGSFFRINRQFLVNRRAVTDANHYQPRKYVVNLSVHFKEVLVVSKNRTADFLEWLTRK
jgi:two-component system response regulator LytT